MSRRFLRAVRAGHSLTVRKCSRNISASVCWCCCILLIAPPVEKPDVLAGGTASFYRNSFNLRKNHQCWFLQGVTPNYPGFPRSRTKVNSIGKMCHWPASKRTLDSRALASHVKGNLPCRERLSGLRTAPLPPGVVAPVIGSFRASEWQNLKDPRQD